MSFNRIVTLSKDEIIQCVEFSKLFSSEKASKSSTEFGRKDFTRSEKEKFADTMTGKLAELAVQKLFQSLDTRIGLDFKIINGYANNDDGQDISTTDGNENSIKCDIKGTKANSQWLLIEEHKFNADVYIIVRLDIIKEVRETPTFYENLNEVPAEVVGFAYTEDFVDKENYFYFGFNRGRRLIKMFIIDKIKKLAMSTIGSAEYTRQDLKKAYLKYKTSLNENIYLGDELKANLNIALPMKDLRCDEEEFRVLIARFKGETPHLKNYRV